LRRCSPMPTRPSRGRRWKRSSRSSSSTVNYTVEVGRGIVKQKGATLPLYAFVQGNGATIANPAPPEVIRGLVAATGSITPTVRFDAAYTLAVLGKPLILKGQFPDATKVVDALIAILRESNPVIERGGHQRAGPTAWRGEPGRRAQRRPRVRPHGGRRSHRRRLERSRRQSPAGVDGGPGGDAIRPGGAVADGPLQLLQEGARRDGGARRGGEDRPSGSIPFLLAQLGSRDAQVRRMAVEGNRAHG